MVILNSCPDQELAGAFPSVRIINLKERPISLGSCRNMAIAQAEPGIICTADDDDVLLPHWLSTIAKRFRPADNWLWPDATFYLENYRIKAITRGMANTFAFTRHAWETVGGYDESLSVGEDRDFARRVTTGLTGERVALLNSEIGYCYNWANRVEHISGRGDDRLGVIPAWERARIKLDKQIAAGNIPTGRIELKPALRHDYAKMANEFLAKV